MAQESAITVSQLIEAVMVLQRASDALRQYGSYNLSIEIRDILHLIKRIKVQS